MATVPNVGDVAAPKGTTPVTPTEKGDDSKQGAVLDAIQKTSVYVNKSGAVATGLQTSAQATANLDYEGGRKVLSGALKIKDKMTEVANKGQKISTAPTGLRTTLAGAGVVAGTTSAIKYGVKTA
ncbi:MAG TPA: hypothetical protein VH208_06110, partial [Myxococcaceae bacterium]|nr:hypothetical protein [Myxococcaceae bacterium]